MFRQYSENGAGLPRGACSTATRSRPQGFPVPEGGHYNEYYPGHVIAMPKPLSDGQVEYPKGEDGQPVAPETVDQYARDVTAFLAWTAEPHLEARKRIGFQVDAVPDRAVASCSTSRRRRSGPASAARWTGTRPRP